MCLFSTSIVRANRLTSEERSAYIGERTHKCVPSGGGLMDTGGSCACVFVQYAPGCVCSVKTCRWWVIMIDVFFPPSITAPRSLGHGFP